MDTNKDFTKFQTGNLIGTITVSEPLDTIKSEMKKHLISEILYWVIAVISIYEAFVKWNSEPSRAHSVYQVSQVFQFLWLFLEDTIERNLTSGPIHLNDPYRL